MVETETVLRSTHPDWTQLRREGQRHAAETAGSWTAARTSRLDVLGGRLFSCVDREVAPPSCFSSSSPRPDRSPESVHQVESSANMVEIEERSLVAALARPSSGENTSCANASSLRRRRGGRPAPALHQRHTPCLRGGWRVCATCVREERAGTEGRGARLGGEAEAGDHRPRPPKQGAGQLGEEQQLDRARPLRCFREVRLQWPYVCPRARQIAGPPRRLLRPRNPTSVRITLNQVRHPHVGARHRAQCGRCAVQQRPGRSGPSVVVCVCVCVCGDPSLTAQ
jgi:hypothetical protein